MKIERHLTQYDAALLSRLAEQLLRAMSLRFNAGEKLLELISEAIILPENIRRDDCVSLFCEVTYGNIGSEEQHSIMIVCPQDANYALTRVSVLAPVAMALIGRPIGAIVDVRLPFGHVQFIKILGIKHLNLAQAEMA